MLRESELTLDESLLSTCKELLGKKPSFYPVVCDENGIYVEGEMYGRVVRGKGSTFAEAMINFLIDLRKNDSEEEMAIISRKMKISEIFHKIGDEK